MSKPNKLQNNSKILTTQQFSISSQFNYLKIITVFLKSMVNKFKTGYSTKQGVEKIRDFVITSWILIEVVS